MWHRAARVAASCCTPNVLPTRPACQKPSDHLGAEPGRPPPDPTAPASGPPSTAHAPLPTSLQGRCAHSATATCRTTFSLHMPRRAARALAALGEAGAPATAGPPPLPHPSINNPREIAAGVAHSRRRAGDLQAAPCGCAGRAHTSGAAGVRGLPGCEHTGSRAQQLDAGPKPQGRECPERAGLAARPDVPPWSKERARLPGTTKRGWRQTNSALHCGANPAAGAARRGGCNSRQRQQKLAARGRAGKCTQLSASPKRARGASTS